jgi:hypothetical protein
MKLGIEALWGLIESLKTVTISLRSSVHHEAIAAPTI